VSALAAMIAETPYTGYTYAYPHKMAYRPLAPPISLRAVWEQERKDALFLYLHVPFCEMRCGFCNLFTTANPDVELEGAYLEALRREAIQAHEAVGAASYARLAIGGGTPTYLRPEALHGLFDVVEDVFGAAPASIPVSCETSPLTATSDRLRVLRERGVDRISIGVQSFVEAEVRASGRAQRTADVHAALERIRRSGFPTLNIDLIYGLPGQTVDSWLASLRAALTFRPEELYLYPLYVRPLTGLGRRGTPIVDQRLACYRAGRDLLLDAGYRQVSMRMFRAAQASTQDGPVYCCQEDGMVGIGCGARSYTRGLHYSGDYAVGAAGVKEILHAYVARPSEAFAAADYGFALDGDDQRRRYALKSILHEEGLSFSIYRARFDGDLWDDLPQLRELEMIGLAVRRQGALVLTEAGLEQTDTIGPWLYSEKVRLLTSSYRLR
jgi:oxygen-independent coproporphyrinogen III oxidase